jgi:antitoxin component YwqK of YwqJK toxin-antitoxin module
MSKRKTALLFIGFTIACHLILWPALLPAKEKPRERDTNGDGKIDQAAYLDRRGRPIRLEIDSNADGRFDKFQFYVDGKLTRLESDRNFDGTIDARDFFKKEKRVRHERLSIETGKLEQVIRFDDQERPLTMEKDTTGDGRFDSRYEFVKGKLARSTRDTDADDRINVWQTFRNDLPLEQKSDGDGDGRIERIVDFDDKGQPSISRHDLDADGTFETVRYYADGEIIRQETDGNADRTPDTFLYYKNAQPDYQKKDSNYDGRFDVATWYAAGQPARQEKDTNFDDKPDVFVVFDTSGQPQKIREDTRYTGQIDRIRYYRHGVIEKVVTDSDGDGFLETCNSFIKGKIATQTQDTNKDNRADITIFFDKKGEKIRVESDTNFSGKVDAWEFYKKMALFRAERDSNHDGKVDLKVYYKDDRRQKLLQDRDHDGGFETTQRFDRAPWSMVMEVDTDLDGTPEGAYCYRNGILREKTVDENGDGRFDFKEIYNGQGKLIQSEEEPDKTGRFTLSWFYDDTEIAVRAEKDRNGDGHTDVWYAYKQNRLAAVTEDTNGDGKPDLWEKYDEAEALIERSRDLDYDGKADVEEKHGLATAPSL